MRRVLIALLLCFAAQPARAELIWKLWCRDPGAAEETPRNGMYDKSAECHEAIANGSDDVSRNCRDTKHGPRLGETYEEVEAWKAYPNCAALKKLWQTCHCKPETVQ